MANGEGGTRVGPDVITGPMGDTRTLAHTGNEVGEDNVELRQNDAGREDVILSWTFPKKFRRVSYAAGRHFTRAELRHRVDRTGHSGTTVDLDGDADLLPIAGESDVSDQPFPTVRVVDLDLDEEVDVVDDGISYGANTFELEDDPAGSDLAIYPVINEGYVKYVAENQFEQRTGPLDPWGIPNHVFSDFKQDNNETRLHLVGAGTFKREESLSLVINAPREVVWEDEDYPDTYVSRWQQKIDVDL